MAPAAETWLQKPNIFFCVKDHGNGSMTQPVPPGANMWILKLTFVNMSLSLIGEFLNYIYEIYTFWKNHLFHTGYHLCLG